MASPTDDGTFNFWRRLAGDGKAVHDRETAAYARATDPETSHEAAESVQATELEAIVLGALKTFTDGATTEEIADSLNLPRDSVSPRMPPLIRKGFVAETELRRKGRSGRNQIVFKAV